MLQQPLVDVSPSLNRCLIFGVMLNVVSTRSCPVALLALVLCVAGCSSGGGKQSTSTTSSSTIHVPPTSPVLRHAVLAGCHCDPALRLSFDYPPSLHLYPIHVDEHYLQIVGYVSNRNLHNPCHPLPNGGECGMPLDRLSNDGVLVEWSFDILMSPIGSGLGAPASNAVVNGHPAEVTTTSAYSACTPLGAARTITARVTLSESEILSMFACLGPGARSEEPAVLSMLHSVHVTAA